MKATLAWVTVLILSPVSLADEALTIAPSLVAQFHCGLNYIRGMAFCPHGKLLCLSGATGSSRDVPMDACLSVWDVTTCTEVRRIRLGSANLSTGVSGRYTEVGALALDKEGRMLAIGVDQAVKLIDATTFRGIWKIEFKDWVDSVSFCPKGHRLAVGATRKVSVWDLAKRKKLVELDLAPLDRNAKANAVFSQDGKMVAFTRLEEKVVWDLEEGKEVAKRAIGPGRDAFSVWANHLVFPPGSHDLLYTATKCWDFKANTVTPLDGNLPEIRIGQLAFSADGKVKAILMRTEEGERSSGTHLLVWLPGDAKSGKIGRRYTWHGESLALSPNGQFLAEKYRGKVAIWDLSTLAQKKIEAK